MSRNLYYEDELLEENFNGFMLKRLVSYAGEYKWDYIRVILLMIGSSFLSLIPAAINMKIINEVLPQNGIVPHNVLSLTVFFLSMWFALSIGSVFANFITSKASTKVGNNIICKLREDLFEKLMELSFDYYDSRPTGKILIRITNYTDEVANFFINDMTRITECAFIMVITIVCICFVEIRMAVMALLVSIPLAVALFFIARALHRCMRVERNKQSNRTAFVAEDINGLEVIKAFNREELNDQIFEELSGQYHKAFMHSTRYREMFFPLSWLGVEVICSVAMYLTALFIITHSIGAELTLGALVVVTTYMQRFSSSLYVICQRLQSITNVTSNVERIFEVLDRKSVV